jgi:hypothetical protein
MVVAAAVPALFPVDLAARHWTQTAHWDYLH